MLAYVYLPGNCIVLLHFCFEYLTFLSTTHILNYLEIYKV